MFARLFLFILILSSTPVWADLADLEQEREMLESYRQMGAKFGEAVGGYRNAMVSLTENIQATEHALAQCQACPEKDDLLQKLSTLYFQRDLSLALGGIQGSRLTQIMSMGTTGGYTIPQACKLKFNQWSTCLGDDQLARFNQWLTDKDLGIVTGLAESTATCMPRYVEYRGCLADLHFREAKQAERDHFEARTPIEKPLLLFDKVQLFSRFDSWCSECSDELRAQYDADAAELVNNERAPLQICLYGPLDKHHGDFLEVHMWHKHIPVDVQSLRPGINNPLLKMGKQAVDSCPEDIEAAKAISSNYSLYRTTAAPGISLYPDVEYKLLVARSEQAVKNHVADESSAFDRSIQTLCADEFGQQAWQLCIDRLKPKYTDRHQGVERKFEVSCPDVMSDTYNFYHDSCAKECVAYNLPQDRESCEQRWHSFYWSQVMKDDCKKIMSSITTTSGRTAAHQYVNYCTRLQGRGSYVMQGCTQKGPLRAQLDGTFIDVNIPCKEGHVHFQCDPTAEGMRGLASAKSCKRIQ